MHSIFHEGFIQIAAIDNFSPHKNDDFLVSRSGIMTRHEMEMKKPSEEENRCDKMYFLSLDNFLTYFFFMLEPRAFYGGIAPPGCSLVKVKRILINCYF